MKRVFERARLARCQLLVALLDSSHLHHRAATDLVAEHAGLGWVSCPLTQNGCLRTLALPSYPNPQSMASVAQRLGKAAADPSHEFWPDGFSLVDEGWLNWTRHPHVHLFILV